jgi:hypothetical protein
VLPVRYELDCKYGDSFTLLFTLFIFRSCLAVFCTGFIILYAFKCTFVEKNSVANMLSPIFKNSLIKFLVGV